MSIWDIFKTQAVERWVYCYCGTQSKYKGRCDKCNDLYDLAEYSAYSFLCEHPQYLKNKAIALILLKQNNCIAKKDYKFKRDKLLKQYQNWVQKQNNKKIDKAKKVVDKI